MNSAWITEKIHCHLLLMWKDKLCLQKSVWCWLFLRTVSWAVETKEESNHEGLEMNTLKTVRVINQILIYILIHFFHYTKIYHLSHTLHTPTFKRCLMAVIPFFLSFFSTRNSKGIYKPFDIQQLISHENGRSDEKQKEKKLNVWNKNKWTNEWMNERKLSPAQRVFMLIY